MKNKLLISSFFACVCLITLVSFTTDNKYFDIARNLDIFTTIFKEVNAYYVDEVEPEPLIHKGINSMLSSLDPYTTFIPEKDVDSYRAMTTGQYGGIGLIVSEIERKAYVTMLYENNAAHKGGVRIGDEIMEIDGVMVGVRNPVEVTEMLKGTPNSEVNMKVRRHGFREPISFTLTREKITISNVPYYGIVENDIGYILLSEFTFGAAKEVTRALNELKSKGAEKIILDLRGNHGGLLNEAVNVSNVFLNKGKEMVFTKGNVEEWNKSYVALNMPVDVHIPLVVLINNSSASASEIVAGVMQDYDRGVLLGRKTFGKGLVQTTRPLSYNTQLKITTAKYYTPSGRCIQRIDYTHRNSNGKAGDVPDSLKTEFKTINGRPVYDGAGLVPDINVEGRKMVSITHELIMGGFLFKYANEFYSKNNDIESIVDFEVTNEEYSMFMEYVTKQQFEYSTQVENLLKVLKTTSSEELIYDKLKAEIEQLNNIILTTKKNDLRKFENEIKLLLKKEIVIRYYLYKGGIQSTIKQDRDIIKAVDLLSNLSQYRSILE